MNPDRFASNWGPRESHGNDLFMKCPIYKLSYLWNVLSMKCLSINVLMPRMRVCCECSVPLFITFYI